MSLNVKCSNYLCDSFEECWSGDWKKCDNKNCNCNGTGEYRICNYCGNAQHNCSSCDKIFTIRKTKNEFYSNWKTGMKHVHVLKDSTKKDELFMEDVEATIDAILAAGSPLKASPNVEQKKVVSMNQPMILEHSGMLYIPSKKKLPRGTKLGQKRGSYRCSCENRITLYGEKFQASICPTHKKFFLIHDGKTRSVFRPRNKQLDCKSETPITREQCIDAWRSLTMCCFRNCQHSFTLEELHRVR